MREEESNWFSKWEDDLPSPDELMPLSQTLISPDLALAFDIRNPHFHHHHQNGITTPTTPPHQHLHHHFLHHQNSHHHHHHQNNSSPVPVPSSLHPNSGEFDSSSAEMGGGGGGGGGAGSGNGSGDEPARTLKRPRLVWTPQLHKRFVDAVAHLGIKNAVPKTIMQLMSVDGLTRENVASHLQKYRLYLKRMQGMNNGGGGGGGGGGLSASGDPATDHLFASSPVPPHFLHQAATRPNSEHYMPYVPVAALHHQQIAAAAGTAGHPQISPPPYHHHHRQMGQFGSPPNGQFEHPFLSRQAQMGPRLNGGGRIMQNSVSPTSNGGGGYVEDLESGTAAANGRKVLTLFPTADD